MSMSKLSYTHACLLIWVTCFSIWVICQIHISGTKDTQTHKMTRLARSLPWIVDEAAPVTSTCACSFEWAEGYTKPFGMYAWRPDGSKDRVLKVLCFTNMQHCIHPDLYCLRCMAHRLEGRNRTWMVISVFKPACF